MIPPPPGKQIALLGHLVLSSAKLNLHAQSSHLLLSQHAAWLRAGCDGSYTQEQMVAY